MSELAVVGGRALIDNGRHGGAAPRARRAARHVAAGLGACLAVVLAVLAGTGWLYLLRHDHALAVGPRLRGALPLQQLAGDDAQPLGRMIVAWLPAGLALGLSLAFLTRLTRFGRAASAALGGILLLPAASAFSDAIAQNDPLRAHLRGGLTSPGVWLAITLLIVGVAVAPPWRVRPGADS